MKKYIKDEIYSFCIAKDGMFHLISDDSDEVLCSEYPKAVSAYYTALMNEALSRGFSAEDFREIKAAAQVEEDPIEYAHSDLRTLNIKKYEEDFEKIKHLAFRKAEMPEYSQSYDIKAYQNVLQAYELYRMQIYDPVQSARNMKIIFNVYVTERKESESRRRIYFSQQEAIKKSSEKIHRLIVGADEMSKDEVINELLDIVSLAIGEEVTAKAIRKKLKGETDNET